MSSALSWILAASIAGVVAGLALVVRGLAGYRSALQVADTSTSTISSAAAGEVRISGVVEPAELTLVSLLQSVPCVYYRASIGNGGDASIPDSAYTEERSVGFRVRDSTGSLRVFPRGARVDAPLRFHDETGLAGDEPPGLAIRTGAATQTAEVDRATAIAELLTVHEPGDDRLCPPGRRHVARAVGASIARRASSRATRSRSSAGRCRSGTSTIRPVRIWAWAAASSRATPRSRPTWRRHALPAPSPTTPMPPGATPRFPASGSDGR